MLLFCSMLWGLTWLALKHFGEFGLQGVIVTLGAHGAVGLCALPWLWKRWARWRPYAGSFALLALFGGLANLSFASAIVLGDVMRVMVLFYLLPAWGVLGGRLILGERIDAQRATSLGAALLGAFLILGGTAALRVLPSWVDLLAVCSGLALALNNIVFRKAQGAAVVDKVAANFVGCLVWAGALALLGFADVPAGVPLHVWFELLGFGLVWILIATAGTLWAVHHLEAGRSSVLIIMELVTAVSSACLLTGKMPTPTEWAGGALILFSALLEAWRPSTTTGHAAAA